MSKFVAVIVLYYPNIEFIQEYIFILNNFVDRIVLVDNTPGVSVEGSAYGGSVDHCILNRNIGIASAQNIGVVRAAQQGADFVLLLDQDSIISKEVIESLLDSMSLALRTYTKVACVGPRVISADSKRVESSFFSTERKLDNRFTSVNQIISSGTLLNLQAVNDIGFFMEKLFIDAVDHEWCWRARSKGYNVLIDEFSIIEQRFGWYELGFGKFSFRVGLPERHYYQFRNSLYLFRYSYVPVVFKIKSLFNVVMKPFLVLLFVGNKVKRMKFIGMGIKDGIIGRFGFGPLE